MKLIPIPRTDVEQIIGSLGEEESKRLEDEIERILNLPRDRRTTEQRIADACRGIFIQYACKILWNIEHHDNIYQDLRGNVELDGFHLQGTTEIKTVQSKYGAELVINSISWNNFENKGIDAPSNVVIWLYKNEIYYPFRILTRKIEETNQFTLLKEYKWPNLNMR
jgi:hypothetical protein